MPCSRSSWPTPRGGERELFDYLANPRSFHETLAPEVVRARCFDVPVGLVLLDVERSTPRREGA